MASSIFCCMPSNMHSTSTFTPSIDTTIPRPRNISLAQDHHLPLLKYKQSSLENPCTSISTIKNPKKSIAGRLATVWREIHGLNNWENLVEPLDPLLQQEIIRYGEFVAACYKAFDLDPTSKRYLNCKYGKKTMLREVGLANSGYEVTKYVYATAPDIINPDQGRWIGYVAVSSNKDEVRRRLGRRDIVVTFRGTVTNSEWIANLMSSLTPARLDPHVPRPDVKVEAGFLSLYTSKESGNRFGLESCREQLLAEISRLLKKHKDEDVSLTFAGHSMGSSLAVLLAYDIAELGLNRNAGRKEAIPVTVFSFGGPRVGNLRFKERCEELGVKVLRVVNVNDPITKLPGILFNENYFKVFRGSWSCSCYAHVGVELLVDFFKLHNPPSVHDLESYIGLLRSWSTNSPNCDTLKGGLWNGDHVNNLVEMAKGFLLGVAERRFDAFQWRNAAIKMIHYGQRT